METISRLNSELTKEELAGIASAIYLKMHDNYQQYGERFSMVDLKGIYETVKKGYERGTLVVFTDTTNRLIGIIMFETTLNSSLSVIFLLDRRLYCESVSLQVDTNQRSFGE